MKVYRRPLTQDEQSSYLEMSNLNNYQNNYTEESLSLKNLNREERLKSIIFGMLISPDFLTVYFPNNISSQFYSFHIASYLSFLFTKEPPDNILLSKAKNKSLETIEQLKNEIIRLINSEKGKKIIGQLGSDWLRLNTSGDLKAGQAILKGINGDGFFDNIRKHFHDNISDLIVNKEVGLDELFQTKTFFIRNSLIADLYGIDWAGPGYYNVGVQRAGILSTPAFTADSIISSSIVLRGAKIRRHVICDTLPTPNLAIIDSREDTDDLPSHVEVSNREYWKEFTMKDGSICLSCHTQMNPIGHIFEGIDGIGRSRKFEEVYDSSGNEILNIHTIFKTDTPKISPSDTVLASNPFELGEFLAKSNKVKGCFIRKSFEYFHKRPFANISKEEKCFLNKMEINFNQSEGKILDIIVNLIANEYFYKK